MSAVWASGSVSLSINGSSPLSSPYERTGMAWLKDCDGSRSDLSFRVSVFLLADESRRQLAHKRHPRSLVQPLIALPHPTTWQVPSCNFGVVGFFLSEVQSVAVRHLSYSKHPPTRTITHIKTSTREIHRKLENRYSPYRYR